MPIIQPFIIMVKNHVSKLFDEQGTIDHLKHYLPSQSPLKDFIHHNTLHAFQNLPFDQGIRQASEIFGYKVSLSLAEYRKSYNEGQIDIRVLNQVLKKEKPGIEKAWLDKMISQDHPTALTQRIGRIRSTWKEVYHTDLDQLVHPLLFRILCSYLDQGISTRVFPVSSKGFLDSIKELEKHTFSSFFRGKRAKALLLDESVTLKDLLKILVGEEQLYTDYLFDQQFAHPGWSGLVAQLEDNPETLYEKKSIKLRNLICFELLLEIDALDEKFGEIWSPIGLKVKPFKTGLFDEIHWTEYYEVMRLWQLSYEWTYFDQVLASLFVPLEEKNKTERSSYQALLCIDDRSCSLRRYLEHTDPNCQTFGTPGFFGVEFYYQPADGSFNTKVCPAPMTPKFLIKETSKGPKLEKDAHFNKHGHSYLGGWLISQTLGFWSALKLAINIFKPTFSPATSVSFKHMSKSAELHIECHDTSHIENDLQVGFTIQEMADRVEGTLKSIGLVENFAPIVYIIGHGSTSTNNTHYAGYDCGACSGRPGSVNARVFSYMANEKKVRAILSTKGIHIPDDTFFIGALHDTSRDEIMFYDEPPVDGIHDLKHLENSNRMLKALELNAKERSRRFESIHSNQDATKVHKKVKRRSVSLFEPRPELNHATNALAIVGRRSLTEHTFLDRRAFMNSYDYRVDPDGAYLTNILNAVAPVCGGINLEYYFSKVDNHRLGAGTKLAHNVMGLVGVANGTDGDLRTGLPSQMIEIHDPLRLLVVVEHHPDIALKSMQKNPITYEWFFNDWIHFAVIDPSSGKLFRFEKGQFLPYAPVNKELPTVENVEHLVEINTESLPVYLIK
ncbi:MAG TPA: DUF2309 domain-containing protein [Saprospiraceae bacterium]|nr:DUF2309 domain-containing protein [Saprospiraceae bacterium]